MQQKRANSNMRGKSGDGSRSVLGQHQTFLPSGFDNNAALALMLENPPKKTVAKDWAQQQKMMTHNLLINEYLNQQTLNYASMTQPL